MQTQIALFICISPWVNLGGQKTRFHIFFPHLNFPTSLASFLNAQISSRKEVLLSFSIILPLLAPLVLIQALGSGGWRVVKADHPLCGKIMSSERLSSTGGKPNNLQRVQEPFVTHDELNKHSGYEACVRSTTPRFPPKSLSGVDKQMDGSRTPFLKQIDWLTERREGWFSCFVLSLQSLFSHRGSSNSVDTYNGLIFWFLANFVLCKLWF